ncbi:hypothetical protein FNT36_23885 [Hymenobacter setariae]|uniref:Plasmid recombination enzyme n=1 Tax=Hymenobacter setariae TaxID=2594794 RepID=A0A558BK71_9BACT|nr:MobV family relaxase [Hymenobacter setariae]TVT36914.1 hypothetical protein FNT36_23885 [Hymenobacter setariae]
MLTTTPAAHVAHAIIRIEKIKTRQGIGQRQAHNDRSKYTPNADESRSHLNQEYLNTENQAIVKLVDKRMEAAGLGKPKEGAVLCVEVLITAGPKAEIWQRDKQTGEAADMRGSEWEKETLAWAKREWGDNLVAMKLHQDEKTPHFQCFVVPILGKGGGLAGEVNLENSKGARLSARDMFSPQTLSQLQTDFAEAMQPFGLERGIKGSRAEHKTMRQMYALGGEKAAEIAPLVEPIEPQPFVLATPPRSLFGKGLEEWRAKQQEEINAEIARQVEAANKRLGTVGAVAVAASGAAEESERSRTWAGDSLQKADAARNEAKNAQDEVKKEASQAQAERERHAAELDKVLLQVAQGALPADLLQRGQDLVAQQMDDLRQAWPVPAALRVQAEQAEKAGDYGLVAELRYGKVLEAEQQVALCREQVQVTPAGRALIAELEEADRKALAEAQKQVEAQQAAETREKERVAEQERLAREQAAEQARAQRAAQEQAVQEEEARKTQQAATDAAAAKNETAERPQDAGSWEQNPQAGAFPTQIIDQPSQDKDEEIDWY